MIKTFSIGAILLAIATPSFAQPCPDVRSASDRHASALLLVKCLGDPDPKVRDALTFEGLSSVMRSGVLEQRTLSELKATLLGQMRRPGGSAILRSFSALTLSEVARTDRLKAWMTDAERQELIDAAAEFLAGISDYRAFSNQEGFVHAVAHGADLALQLALNPAVVKPQLDQLLTAISSQITPGDSSVAYWAGEPDRLARAVLFIAQRKLHSDAEWTAWFQAVMNPKPLSSWDVAFSSEIGIRKHHNVRAFLLSVYASAVSSEDVGIKQVAGPARDSLKLVP